MTKFTAIELTDGQIIDVSKFTESDEGRSITFQRLGDDGPKYIIVKYRTPMTYELKKISYPPYTVFMWVKRNMGSPWEWRFIFMLPDSHRHLAGL